ncbi:uncharacterized protein LOC124414968 isoform X1 [Diprion similis]|uniref:uncharacterized protein LOC124414968 isoform X1 n=1 Tax=Diprion similis TaxID=362088 RepID=UPI001EF95517|nr:uncharacterized protein LOC124414968 isoform X1 [Diprion similis]
MANGMAHSPVNTPCPSYRAHAYDFLDDTTAADHRDNYNSMIGRSRVLCPVEIHVDASVENAEGAAGSQRNLLNLDSDDENILGSRCMFLGGSQSSDNTPERATYPDANSHSNYNLLTEDTHSFDSWTRKIRASHSSEANSHCVSIANSHETYRVLSESCSDCRTGPEPEDLSVENLIPRDEANYEIANSHSNYQVFYNSQTRFDLTSSPARSDSSRTSRSTEETSTTCDIEECLVQIEESLLNIEQNLLQVQDLDIPELKNLLYKSPSIERSLFEVQDLLCTENIESVKRGQFSFTFSEESDELVKISGKNLSPDSDHDTFTNDDNLLQFNDDKPVASAPPNLGELVGTCNSSFCGSVDKNVNFIPNSLSKTPTKGRFKEAGKNIKSHSMNSGDLSSNYREINDNLNSRIEDKKLVDSKKCHSRTNSLDENEMMFQVTGDPGWRGKSSFESLQFKGENECGDRYLEVNVKAKSDDTLDNKSLYGKKRSEQSSRRSRRKLKGNRLAEVEAKTDEFRRKIESIISSRKSALPSGEKARKNSRSNPGVGNTTETRKNSQERSPRVRKSSLDKITAGRDSPNAKQFKSNSFEKRKRKKTGRVQNADNAALVPSKLISLSLSLLLAALLQAVRCLTDLVDDAFRSVSYDRNGLME